MLLIEDVYNAAKTPVVLVLALPLPLPLTAYDPCVYPMSPLTNRLDLVCRL